MKMPVLADACGSPDVVKNSTQCWSFKNAHTGLDLTGWSTCRFLGSRDLSDGPLIAQALVVQARYV
jgi:hypothetical protein